MISKKEKKGGIGLIISNDRTYDEIRPDTTLSQELSTDDNVYAEYVAAKMSLQLLLTNIKESSENIYILINCKTVVDALNDEQFVKRKYEKIYAQIRGYSSDVKRR